MYQLSNAIIVAASQSYFKIEVRD